MKTNYITEKRRIQPAYINLQLFGGITFYYGGDPQFFTFHVSFAEEVGIVENKIYALKSPSIDNTEIDISERPELPARFGDYKQKINETLRVIISGSTISPVEKQINGTFLVESYNIMKKFEKFDDKQVVINIIGSNLIELSTLKDTMNSDIPLFAPTCEEVEKEVYLCERDYQLELG